jgi:serine/threonine protein kinase/Tol biopolymer transport system component
MRPERWKRTEELYHEARTRPKGERAAFLAEACRDDEGLRRDVESLLNEPVSDDGFLGAPVLAAQPVADTTLVTMTGRSLGGYYLQTLIGAGGMGEVYLAHDAKLGRDVAIKILPPALTSDPDRVARLEREARMLAALNHPNICAIYGLEEADGIRFLILELVDGDTLAHRLAEVSRLAPQGSGLPLRDALTIARQITTALEVAHERGIIHRDLKPTNIKITPDGVVKILDFGLAKAVGGQSSTSDLTQAPVATRNGPREGTLIGTAAYMSAEQACGKVVDRRTDIWAFGVIVFEMLAGHRPFTGETISETLASVLKTDPNWSALPATVPPDLRELLRRCLEKDPKRRLQAIGDARVQIEDLLSAAPEEWVAAVGSSPPRRRQRALPWVATGALAVALLFALTRWAPWRPLMSPPPFRRLSVELGADVSLARSAVGAATILSPDGEVVVFVAQKGGSGSPQLYVRRLDQLQATRLSGTDDADGPFFSKDGQWVAFFAGGKLKKISVTGGLVVTLCDAPNGRGGAWAEDGTVVFSPDLGQRVSLLRVSSDGGKPEPLTSLAEGEVTQRWPQILPGGTAVLYTGSSSPGDFGDANLVVQPLARGTPNGARKVVVRGGYQGRYLPSGTGSPKRAEREGGHLVYIHDGKLLAAPFDLERLEVTGQPVSLPEGVASNADTGGAQFAVSASGTLVYLPGQSVSTEVPIHWMDREGKTTPLRATPAYWSNLLFAPDGRRLAMQIAAPSDIWVYEWARDELTKLTSDPAYDSKPVWTPDGRRIVFGSARADQSTLNLYWQPVDGPGGPKRLTVSKNQQRPASWHKSGKFLAFEEQNPTTSWDLMILPLEGDDASGWKPGEPTVFLSTPSVEREPMFSPDGRWLAYYSNESGPYEVYVRPFPGLGSKSQRVSAGGGTYPLWSRTKPELFYGVNGQIMVVSYAVADGSFRGGKPQPWSDGHYLERPGNRGFDLHPDGVRFALALPASASNGAKQDHVTFIFNFFEELRRMAPATTR